MATASHLAVSPGLVARPWLRLGAESPGGLALPPAHPTASQLYAPRGVYLDDQVLVVADTGNHRVLIWHGLPEDDGAPAQVVLGQPDFTTEGPAAGGRGQQGGLYMPTGVGLINGRLFVADAWHHRVLVWEELPTTTDTPPDWVLGQPNATTVTENRGAGTPDACSFYWPYGICYDAGWFYVADTGNRRVLGWHGLPAPEQPADLVLGQPSFTTREENRGRAVGPDSFRWPHAIAGHGDMLLVADAGNHRVLGWSPRPRQDRPACLVLGQEDYHTAQEWPYGPQGPNRLRFPYALAVHQGRLAVADTANNRVLVWSSIPRQGAFWPAAAVLGQLNFEANGENRWQGVEKDTLCWPYGLAWHGNLLAIADSGNNRIVIWRLEKAAGRDAEAA
ncbi:MAG: NHL repeat-containing protein [Caldilineaceae bacterium]|nr:NHL repeat-containing protein [Caldilineaceae bacterium]